MVQREVKIDVNVPGLPEARSGLQELVREIDAVNNRAEELRTTLTSLQNLSRIVNQPASYTPEPSTPPPREKQYRPGRFVNGVWKEGGMEAITVVPDLPQRLNRQQTWDKRSLMYDQEYAVRRYLDIGYNHDVVNSTLRGDTKRAHWLHSNFGHLGTMNPNNVSVIAPLIDSVISQSKLSGLGGVPVYRGDKRERPMSLGVGDLLSDNSYKSFSTSLDTALRFADDKDTGARGALFEYILKDIETALYDNGPESEILFPRDKVMRIVAKRDEIINGITRSILTVQDDADVGLQSITQRFRPAASLVKELISKTQMQGGEHGTVLSGTFEDLKPQYYSKGKGSMDFIKTSRLLREGEHVLHTHDNDILALSPADFTETPLLGKEHTVSSIIGSGDMMTAKVPAGGVPKAFLTDWSNGIKSVIQQGKKQKFNRAQLNEALTSAILELANKHGVEIVTRNALSGGMQAIQFRELGFDINDSSLITGFEDQIADRRNELSGKYKNAGNIDERSLIDRKLNACTLMKSAIENATERMLIAVDGKKILGALLPDYDMDENTAHIDTLANMSDVKGIGGILLKMFEETAIREGKSRASLFAKEDSVPFYEGEGYSDSGVLGRRGMEKELGSGLHAIDVDAPNKRRKTFQPRNAKGQFRKPRTATTEGDEQTIVLQLPDVTTKAKTNASLETVWDNLVDRLGKDAVSFSWTQEDVGGSEGRVGHYQVRVKDTIKNLDKVKERIGKAFDESISGVEGIIPEGQLDVVKGAGAAPKSPREQQKKIEKEAEKELAERVKAKERMYAQMAKEGERIRKENDARAMAKTDEIADRVKQDKQNRTFGGYEDLEKEFGPYKEATLNVGEMMDNLVKKGGALSSLSWQFASVAMSSMGVYFSLMGITMMIQQGLSAIFNPLRNVESLIQGYAQALAFAPELETDNFLSKMGVSLEDIIDRALWLQGVFAHIQIMFAGFGAKVLLDPEVQDAIHGIVDELENFLLEPETFELVKGIIIAIRDAMPAILNGVRMLGNLIKDWLIPHADMLAFAWAMSLVIQPLVSIVSFFVNITKLVSGLLVDTLSLLRYFNLIGDIKIPMAMGQGNVPVLWNALGVKSNPLGKGMQAINVEGAIVKEATKDVVQAAAPAATTAIGMPAAEAAMGTALVTSTIPAEAGLAAKFAALGARLGPLLTNPITIAVAVALAAIGVMWITNFAGFRDSAKKFIEDIKPAFHAMATSIKGAFSGIGDSIKRLGTSINELWSKIFGTTLTRMFSNKIKEMFLDITILVITISEAVSKIFDAIGVVVDWISSKIDGIADKIEELGLMPVVQGLGKALELLGVGGEARVNMKQQFVDDWNAAHPIAGGATSTGGVSVETGDYDPIVNGLNTLNDTALQQLNTEAGIKTALDNSGANQINYKPYSELTGGPLNTGGLRAEDVGHVYADKTALDTTTSMTMKGATQYARILPDQAAARVLTTSATNAPSLQPNTELDNKLTQASSLTSLLPFVSQFTMGSPVAGFGAKSMINSALGSAFGVNKIPSDIENTNVLAQPPFDEMNTTLSKSQKEQETQTEALKSIDEGIDALNGAKAKATSGVSGSGLKLGVREVGDSRSKIVVGGVGTSGEGTPTPDNNNNNNNNNNNYGENTVTHTNIIERTIEVIREVFDDGGGSPEVGGRDTNTTAFGGAPDAGFGGGGTGGRTGDEEPGQGETYAPNNMGGFGSGQSGSDNIIINAIETVTDTVVDAFTTPGGPIAYTVSTIGNFFKGIMGAAEGGLITQTGLVNVHRGEVIGPIDSILPSLIMSSASAPRQQTSAPITVNINIEGSATKEVTDDMIRKLERHFIGRGA